MRGVADEEGVGSSDVGGNEMGDEGHMRGDMRGDDGGGDGGDEER